MRVEDKIDSDHHPVVIRLKEEERRERWRGERKDRRKRGIWNEEGKEAFRQRIEGVGGEEERIRVERKEVEKRIREAIDEVEKEIGESNKNKKG